MMTRGEFLRVAAALIARATASAIPAVAQTDGAAAPAVGTFYRGRRVTLIVPTPPGGINDLSGRLVARHLGRFIPGNPTIVAENREQGGGLALANSFTTSAAKDGSVIGIIQRGIPQLAIQGDPGAKFDPLALTWLGSLSSFATDAYILVLNARQPAKSLRDLARSAAPARPACSSPWRTATSTARSSA